MATISEDKDSRRTTSGDDLSAELRFTIRDENDDGAVRLLLLAAAPPTYIVAGKTLVQKSRSHEPRGGGIWKCSVQYGRRKDEKETGESSYQFEIGGGTAHVTQVANELQTSYAPGGETAPEMSGHIKVTKEGDSINVEGVDIDAPSYAWSETHYLPIGAVTPAYKAILFSLAAAPVNNAAWRGFAAGEVKFKGASGQQRGEEDWAVTFKFEASPNVTGMTIGEITGIAKKGWEYLWVLSKPMKDPVSNVLVPKPVAVYVAQVYGESNFALLGIGG